MAELASLWSDTVLKLTGSVSLEAFVELAGIFSSSKESSARRILAFTKVVRDIARSGSNDLLDDSITISSKESFSSTNTIGNDGNTSACVGSRSYSLSCHKFNISSFIRCAGCIPISNIINSVWLRVL